MPISRLRSNRILGITMGDPSGIGPELILKAMPRKKRGFLVIGSKFVLEQAAKRVGLSAAGLNIYDLDNVPGRGFGFGKISAIYGRASYEYIKEAFRLIKEGKIGGLVTAPISKEAIKKAGYPFGGHTEILARLSRVKDAVMMLVSASPAEGGQGGGGGGNLRVALVTRHIPLRNVSRSLSCERIYRTIEIVDKSLKKYFRINSPKIGVCGLNPHAGEGGVLGGEEKKLIRPAIKRAKRNGIRASGPHPADAIFYDAIHKEYDCVISMYHDQGLAPLKMLYRDRGVNVTLGLPFVRTSPDHGTAFDIAGKGIANPSSMKEAIKLAQEMLKR